ncbi:hypothetical protein HZH68_014891 [Vespula germanica]|uniref:Uncharacterized protein n=1 Tax=Vespula germanica TaxID=30212 RepID=A0A834MRU8_VESGE|nr:hypothetical protein HZH68_014891 [Vespula germanica]
MTNDKEKPDCNSQFQRHYRWNFFKNLKLPKGHSWERRSSDSNGGGDAAAAAGAAAAAAGGGGGSGSGDGGYGGSQR